MKLIDLTGQKFNRLYVISRAGTKGKRPIPAWLCICDCGNNTVVSGRCLASGNTKSCGCFRRENSTKLGKATYKHGMDGTPVYRVWGSMKSRCNNENHDSYASYGGRGISVCERWNDFEAFYADMGDKPEKLSIDRIDNNGNYTPSNCRWATKREQDNNKRTNVIIAFMGRSMTIAQWEIFLDRPHRSVRNRLRAGWSVKRALTEPIRHYNRPPK